MHRLLKLTGALALVLGITACQKEGPVAGEPYLSVSASPHSIDDQGQTTTLHLSATDAAGNAGTGTVEVTASAGILDNDQTTVTVALTDGSASLAFKCPKSQDTNCHGTVTIDATWDQATARTTVSVTAGTTGSDGGSDGGTDGGSTPPDGGTGSSNAVLSLTASKSPIFYNVGDSSLVTATLKHTNDAGWAGETIAFSTTLGGLTPPDGGTPVTTLSATTAADGTAAVRFVETGSAGTASIQGVHQASGQTKTVQVDVTTVQQITYKSTLCNGAACTIMGVRGSGFNEQAQITFTLKDSSNRPASGVTVTFSIPNPPKETTVTPSGITNAQGEVTATISAGPTIGSFVVHATAIPGMVEVDGPNIGIRGAKAANGGFSLKCDTVNIGAHASASPPATISVNCKVKVVDRYNNPVGTGTTVNFKTEAGTITNSVVTTAYNPTTDNANEGVGSLVFQTFGGRYPPVDVDPLDAELGQFPFPRIQEPSAPDGQLIRNPRDSLVTIIAYTRGEEWFADNNSNGVRDPDEQFIDQGEPFVDSNDNGVWDPGEIYIDEAPADGKWNGPNGVWDKDTSIWTEMHILYTGRPSDANTKMMVNGSPFSPPVQMDFAGACGDGELPRGGAVNMNVYFADVFFNRPQASGTTFSAVPASRTNMLMAIGSLQDAYGFGIDRIKVNAADGTDCLTSTNVCAWKTVFYDWSYGYVGGVAINNTTSASDPVGCGSVTDYVKATVLSVDTFAHASGGIH